MRERSLRENRTLRSAQRSRSGESPSSRGPSNTAPEPGSIRKIVVMMSFGGNDPRARSIAALKLMRLKHLVAKCTVLSRYTNKPVRYVVGASSTHDGPIAPYALQEIRDADVLIGLITDKNANVIYEVTVRNLLRKEMLLVVTSDMLLPLYLKDLAYIVLRKTESEECITKLAEKREYDLNVGVIPRGLCEVIDASDGYLLRALQDALQKLETHGSVRQPFVQSLMDDFEPDKLATSWRMFYPTSIIEVDWKRKSGIGSTYALCDIHGEPKIASSNVSFKQLYNVEGADEHAVNSMTRADLLRQVKDFTRNLKDVESDQTVLSKKLIFGNEYGFASVPFRFNDRHPYSDFRSRAYFPCLVGKKVFGQRDRPHHMYLQVVYIPEFSQQRTADGRREALR